jgi:hypothetical protein
MAENSRFQVIQRRGDFGEPRTNFTAAWSDYKNGFGDLYGEFWFGNDFIHRISNEAQVNVFYRDVLDPAPAPAM